MLQAGFTICVLLGGIFFSTKTSMAGQNRAQRVIAELSATIDFEDSLRVAHRARGEDRRTLREAAHRAYESDRRRARQLSRGAGDYPLLRLDRAFNDGQQNWSDR